MDWTTLELNELVHVRGLYETICIGPVCLSSDSDIQAAKFYDCDILMIELQVGIGMSFL